MQFLLSAALGALLTYLALNHDIEPPAIFELPQKIQAFPQLLIASSVLDDPEAERHQKQMALATLIKHNSSYLVTLDREMNNQISQFAAQRSRTRRLTLLRQHARLYQKKLVGDEHKAIREALFRHYQVNTLEALSRAQLEASLTEQPALLAALKKRYNKQNKAEIASILLSDAGLLLDEELPAKED